MKHPAIALFIAAIVGPWAAFAQGPTPDRFVKVPGGEFVSVLAYDETKGKLTVPPFTLMKKPVTNGEFLKFVKANPQWQKQKVPAVFAESRYLSHWAAPLELGANALPDQPVVHVSWFAATAYCESMGARLPTWHEWEFAAASDATRADARSDPAWTQSILDWYARPSTLKMSAVGAQKPNLYGVYDMHGLVWEWVEDVGAMRVSGGSRGEKSPDGLSFCGSGAISMNDKENYAVLMRTAMLSALSAKDVTVNLGFRCARSLHGGKK